MIWLTTSDEGVLIKGTTPEHIPQLRAAVHELSMRWDRSETAWLAPGADAGKVRKALVAAGLTVSQQEPSDGFGAIVKARRKKRRGPQGKKTSGSIRPPRGFTAIPKSKAGGYRKRSGNKYVYWYPDGSGERTRAEKTDVKSEAKELGSRIKTAHTAAVSVSKQLHDKVKALSTDVGKFYANNHHKIDELIELVHVAETWAHLHGIHAKHVLTHAVHMAMSDDQSDADLRKAEED